MDQTMFTVIGAQKSGTTWLYDYFRKHPDVFVPYVKELNYFWVKSRQEEEREIARLARTLTNSLGSDSANGEIRKGVHLNRIGDVCKLIAVYSGRLPYKSLFSARKKSHKAFGELSPSYAMLGADDFSQMASIYPDFLFIFVMRDPIDRFWSAIRMLSDRKPGALQKKGGVRNVFYEQLDSSGHLYAMTDYAQTITNLERTVQPQNIHYMFYEDIFSPNGHEALCKMTDFLGIRAIKGDLGKKVWQTGTKHVSPDELDEEMYASARSAFAHVYDFANEKFGPLVPEAWNRQRSWTKAVA